MIEVEIRGRLVNLADVEKLKTFLHNNGRFIVHRDREMYLLYNYPGYCDDMTKRRVDIRLRNTNGDCEIMVKIKASDNNVGREEYSLALKDHDLVQAKKTMRVLGFHKALKMNRVQDIYEYNGFEWSVTTLPKNLSYFEIESQVTNPLEIEPAIKLLKKSAQNLNLNILTSDETRAFIELLDKEVNEEVEF